jgi:hypothetical protein
MKRLTDFSKEDDILSSDHEDTPGNVAIGVTHVYPVTHTRSYGLDEAKRKNPIKKLFQNSKFRIFVGCALVLLLKNLLYFLDTEQKYNIYFSHDEF